MPQIVLDPSLLEAEPHATGAPGTFAACLNARGLYNTEHFVVRLSPRIHELVAEATSGIHGRGELSGEAIQAYSTYLHETIHWWQHMGSTSGLIASLAGPVQAHISGDHLETVVRLVGGRKSLKQWAEDQMRTGLTHADPALKAANIAVNNAVDADFFKVIVHTPPLTASCQQDRYFESVGHSFGMAYGLAVSLLAGTVDPDFEHLPGGGDWDAGFEAVRAAGIEGFVHQGVVGVAALGTHALYEGQARMAQLQFLVFGLDEPLSLSELRGAGYFDGIYGEAFDYFLKVTGFGEPEHVDDPIVALFLLVVDLAINPTRGFPFEIQDFANFIYDTDPGIRFLRLSQVARDRPDLASRITAYSREEYVDVSETLLEACDYDSTLMALEAIAGWATAVPGVARVMRERETFDYEPANLVVRVLFSHFVALSQDKLAHPEFFCWPGAWMAGRRAGPDSQAMFLRHLSLYSDQANDDGIFPRQRPGVDPANLVRTLNVFYQNIILYDLTRQWILKDGPFEYDFSWLSQRLSKDEMKAWAKDLFAQTYGIHPDDFELTPT